MKHELTVDHMGCSQVHINTEKGSILFTALDKNNIDYCEITKQQAFQPNLRHPTRKNRVYDQFATLCKAKKFRNAAYTIADRKTKVQIIIHNAGLSEFLYKIRHR